MIYHFLPERMKIEKVEKLVANLQDKREYVIYIRKFKQAITQGLVLKRYKKWLKKVFNQKALLKSYINMNRKVSKNDFEIDFFKLMSNSVFSNMENVKTQEH